MKWKIATVVFALLFLILSLALAGEPDSQPYAPTTEEEIATARPDIQNQAENLKRGVVTVRGTAFGTGFVVHRDGYVFTNAHVVGDDEEVEVGTKHGGNYTAEVVATADKQRVDLAILKVDENMNDVKVLEFGNSSQLQKGDMTFNIGHPALFYGWAIMAGEVYDLKEREILLDKPGSVGESGSPLFDMNGKVVGIVKGASPPPRDKWVSLDSADDIVIWNGNYQQYRSRSQGEADRTEQMYNFTEERLGKEKADGIFGK